MSGAPEAIGRCLTDVVELTAACNEATQRLLQTNKNQGFWGTAVPMAFTVVGNYITGPRNVARITDLAVCNQPVNIRNGFYEFLMDGAGVQPPIPCCTSPCAITEALDRGVFPTQATIATSGYGVRIYSTDPRDVGKRLLIQGLDQNGLAFRCQDGFSWVLGQYMDLAAVGIPTNIGFEVSKITGIQKDTTYGDVLLYEYNITTGANGNLLARFAPDETEPSYRRYYLNNLPTTCCNTVPATQVTGMVKLEYVPVSIDTDWLGIQNIPALIEECMAIRYGRMDSPQALQMAAAKHREAIRLLNNELDHYTDRNRPAVGLMKVERRSQLRARVGTMI